MKTLKLLGTALAVMLTALFPAAAQAAGIQITGDAKACFASACDGATPTFSDSIDFVLGGVTLSYLSNLGTTPDFNGTTSDDQLAIQGATGNFGTLSVTGSGKVNTTFGLMLTFINPTSDNTTFHASLRGSVTNDPLTGGIRLVFSPGTAWDLPYSIPSANQSGTMDLTVDSLSIASGGSAALTGFVETHPQPVPEPGSLLLLGTGLAMLAIGLRRSSPSILPRS